MLLLLALLIGAKAVQDGGGDGGDGDGDDGDSAKLEAIVMMLSRPLR